MSTISTPAKRRPGAISALALVLLPLSLLLGAASPSGGSCCVPPPPVHAGQYLLRAAGTTPCTPSSCVTAADALVCAVSKGCGSDGQCSFMLKTDASCACYESDFRACPGGGGAAQACARTGAASTAWQVASDGHPVCGPTQVACETHKPACPTGRVETRFDLATLTWVVDPNGACVPDPACPKTGDRRECKTGSTRCPDGRQTFDGQNWSTTCEPVNCPVCVTTLDTPCGCGGTIQCNGSCSAPGPSNLGQGCGCGGTIQCNGSCSAPGPSNLGQGCGCGGTIQCDGSCSAPCVDHPLKAVFTNIDDDAYVWLDHPGSTDQAICRINGGKVPRSGECDLQAALRQRGAVAGRLVFKIGNGGGFGSKGTMQIFENGAERWRGDEIDNGWKHTGWTYCSKVEVNLDTGSVVHQCTSSCALWLDCDNECKDCP